MKTTKNYGLKKPESSDLYNVDDFNENADAIDEKLKELETPIYTEATTPTALVSGEKLSVSFGKIAKAVKDFISHITTKATTSVLGHVKVTDSSAVTDTTGLALAATEKNAAIGGTLANQISKVNSDLGKKFNKNNILVKSDVTEIKEQVFDNGMTLIRTNNTDVPNMYCYGSGVAFANGDTYGFFNVAFNMPAVFVGGGNNAGTGKWEAELALKRDAVLNKNVGSNSIGLKWNSNHTLEALVDDVNLGALAFQSQIGMYKDLNLTTAFNISSGTNWIVAAELFLEKGTWVISLYAQWDSNSAGDRGIGIQRASDSAEICTSIIPAPNGSCTQNVVWLEQSSGTNYCPVFKQSSGGNLNVQACFMRAVKII